MEKNYIVIDAELTGQRLKKAFKDNGYSVREIQYKLDLCCPQGIYRWLQGKTLPSLANLYMLSQILQVSMEELIVTRNIVINREKEY